MTFMDGAAAPASDPVKNGSDQAFMADVIEASRETPVIVDFWAPWCGPCKTLAPMIEKAVRAANGAVKLVKINIDENPGVAGQLGVRSIPAVYAFDKGKPVDGFMGAIPESQIKMFVDRLAGAGSEDDIKALLEQAAESVKLGDIGGAAQSFMAVLQLDQYNTKAIAGMARIALDDGDAEQAREILAHAPEDKANDPDIAGVRAALDLAANSKDEGESAALKAKIAANADDFQSRYELSAALAAGGDFEGAVDQLLAIIAKNKEWNEDAARQQLFKVFEAAGQTSDVTRQGRRKLSAILFA